MEIKFRFVMEREDESTYLTEPYTLEDVIPKDNSTDENERAQWVGEIPYICTLPQGSLGTQFDVYLGDILEVHRGDSLRPHYAVIQQSESGSFGYETPARELLPWESLYWFYPESMDIYHSEDDFETYYVGYKHTGMNILEQPEEFVEELLKKKIERIYVRKSLKGWV